MLYLGRMTTAKGIEIAYRALAELRREHGIDARLVQVGPAKPEMAAALKRLAAELDLTDAIDDRGRLDTDELAPVLAQAGALVLPTVEWEAFGLVIVEAGLARVPVVAARIGGVPEVVADGEHALLFEPGDVVGLRGGTGRRVPRSRGRGRARRAGVRADAQVLRRALPRRVRALPDRGGGDAVLMEHKARRSIPVSILSYATNQVLRLGATVVLARILVPEDFGLFALTSLAISLLSIFNDFGVGPALVVARDLDRRTKSTALTLMIAASVLLAALLVALAPLIADLFDEAELDELLIVVAGSLLLSGPIWFHETTLQRDLEFGKRFATKLAQTLTYIVVAITLAVLDAGVWSLVIGHVASYVAYLAALVAVADERIPPGWDGAAARRLAGSGRGFLAQDALEYAQQQSDAVAVGGFLGAGQLGLYAMGFRFGELTYVGVADPIAQVTFPAFSRMRARGEDWRPSFRHGPAPGRARGLPARRAVQRRGRADRRHALRRQVDGHDRAAGGLRGVGHAEAARRHLRMASELTGASGTARHRARVRAHPVRAGADDRGRPRFDHDGGVGDGRAHGRPDDRRLTRRSARAATSRCATSCGPWRPPAVGAVAAWVAARGTAGALDDAAPLIALAGSAAACFAAYAATASAVEPRLLPNALAQARRTIQRG